MLKIFSSIFKNYLNYSLDSIHIVTQVVVLNGNARDYPNLHGLLRKDPGILLQSWT
jgi:hypothetical protein